MQKILCLPKISIKDLQEQVKLRRTTHRYNYQDDFSERQHSHNNDIKITSPFYKRCTGHKGKCLCQYHRLKKDTQNVKPIIKNKKENFYFSYGKTLHLNLSQKPEHMKLHIDSHLSKLKINPPHKIQDQLSLPSLLPLLLPLPLPLPIHNNSKHVMEEQYQDPIQSHLGSSITLLQQRSVPKISTRKAFKSIKARQIIEATNEQANSKIDALNREYIELVSQRLKNEQFKQKYLKTLFSFIRMKSNENKLYMYSSQAYIKNSLNILLNHFTMEKLLNEELSQEDLQQIAYYMNCLPQKVKDIIADLKNVVSEMEHLLTQMRIKRKQNQDKQNKNNSNHLSNTTNSKYVRTSTHINPSERQQKKISDQYVNTKQSSLFSSINMTTSSAFRENVHFKQNIAEPQMKSKTSKKQKYSIMRTSSRKVNELHYTSPIKKISENNKQEKPEKPEKQEKQEKQDRQQYQQINRKRGGSINKATQALNRSMRSTVLGKVDEVEKQGLVSKKKITTKLKKIKIKSKYTSLEQDQKYKNIYYDKYLTKGGFKKLISQIERVEQTDQEKAQIIFKELNIEKYIDDSETIEDIIKTFLPLFNERSLHAFKKKIVFLKDQRYIQQLQKQLDDMITQIRKNDPREQPFQFFETKSNHKHMPLATSQLAKCRQFKIQKQQEINRIKYFEAEQQIQRHINRQQSIKLHLQQIDLKEITLDPINPALTAAITHDPSLNRRFGRSKQKNLPELSEQKKILQYMKRNHEGTFNYLASEFTTICRSLPSEHA